MSRTIYHQFTFPQSADVVWDYLTRADLLAQWLMPNDLKPVVGHKFTMKTKAIPKFGFDGIVHCEILEVVVQKKLVYSWKGGTLNTVVVWTLTPAQDATVLTLEHSGFRGLKNFLPYIFMNRGWAKIGKRFMNSLNAALV